MKFMCSIIVNFSFLFKYDLSGFVIFFLVTFFKFRI